MPTKRSRDLNRNELQRELDEAVHILRIGMYAYERLDGTSKEAEDLIDRAKAFLNKHRSEKWAA